MKTSFRSFAEEALSPMTFLLWLPLAPLGLLYRWVQLLRALLYRQGILSTFRAPQPVISIGNLTAGGTGKTPVVDHLLRYLLQQGEKPAVVSRGYGGRIRRGVVIVSRGDQCDPLFPAEVCGDEPFLLARRNPQAVVVVAPRRREGIVTAIEECGATLILLDDGFQHLAVERDLDILLLDARRPLGNGSLLPAGLLREPPSAHHRAHLSILTRDESLDTSSPFPELPTLRCRHRLADKFITLDGSSLPFRELLPLRGVAFAGIAAPLPFFQALQDLGFQLVDVIPLNDHVIYDADTLARLMSAAASADFFVTTEKDGVKLKSSDLSLPCYQAPLEVEFAPSGRLEEIVAPLLKSVRAS